MKSLLALFFSLTSSVVFSAGITIELDSAVSIGSIEYVGCQDYVDMGGPSVDGFNVEGRDTSDGIASASIRSLMLPDGDIHWTEWSTDLSGLVASYYTVDDEVAIAVMDCTITELQATYHETLLGANVEYILGPYLRSYALDHVENRVWGRGALDADSQLFTWQDLDDIKDIPEGDIENFILVTGDQLYLSIDTGVKKGIWKIDAGASLLVSDALNSEASLITTVEERVMQFIPFRSGAGFIGRVLDQQNGQGFSDYTFSGLSVAQIDDVKGLVDSSGEMYIFSGTDFQEMKWLANGQVHTVSLPEGVTSFDECFSTNGRILCLNQGIFENGLYEWDGSEFVLDVSWPHFWLDFEDAGNLVYQIIDIEAVGEHRYVLYNSGQKILLMDHGHDAPLEVTAYSTLGGGIESSHLELREGVMLLNIEDDDRMHGMSFELAEDSGFITLSSGSGDLSNTIEDYELYEFSAGETGAISVYKYKDDVVRPVGVNEFLYQWAGSDGTYFIEAPYRTSGFEGCFESLPQLFCVFRTTDDFVILFELEDGVFRADTKIGNSKTMKEAEIKFIKAYGDKRYGLVHVKKDTTNDYMAFMAEPLASYELTSSSCDIDEVLYASIAQGEIRLISCLGDQIDFNQIEYDNDAEYVQNTFNGADQYVYIESRDGEVVQEVPRSEIAGQFSLAMISFLLMLLAFRVPITIKPI